MLGYVLMLGFACLEHGGAVSVGVGENSISCLE